MAKIGQDNMDCACDHEVQSDIGHYAAKHSERFQAKVHIWKPPPILSHGHIAEVMRGAAPSHNSQKTSEGLRELETTRLGEENEKQAKDLRDLQISRALSRLRIIQNHEQQLSHQQHVRNIKLFHDMQFNIELTKLQLVRLYDEQNALRLNIYNDMSSNILQSNEALSQFQLMKIHDKLLHHEHLARSLRLLQELQSNVEVAKLEMERLFDEQHALSFKFHHDTKSNIPAWAKPPTILIRGHTRSMMEATMAKGKWSIDIGLRVT